MQKIQEEIRSVGGFMRKSFLKSGDLIPRPVNIDIFCAVVQFFISGSADGQLTVAVVCIGI